MKTFSFRNLSRLEKVMSLFFFMTFLLSFGNIIQRYIQDHSQSIPTEGGIYSEGMIGKYQNINPLFSSLNPTGVDLNISTLLFSGLMKYNPETQSMVDDLATHTLDISKKTYTFSIRDNVFWHDGKKVTADDIMFTFQEIIQNPDFKNQVLRENFNNVRIQKINDKTITFTLKSPYKFFLTNFTVGILPKHILEDIPVENLQMSEFNTIAPIGTGPYQFSSFDPTPHSTKISLKRFDKFYGKSAYITNLDFYIFPNQKALQNSLDIIDGIDISSISPQQLSEEFSSYSPHPYHTARYVAAFFNTQSQSLKNQGTRLALSLGINKTKLLAKLEENHQVDTPFLELSDNNWLLEYDQHKAQGALNDADWKLPWKQTVQTKEEINNLINITNPKITNSLYTTNSSEFFIQGSVPDNITSVWVNNYKLSLFNTEKHTFSYKASLAIKTLKPGKNTYIISGSSQTADKKILGTFDIFYSTDESERKAIEQKYAQKEKTKRLKKENLENEKTKNSESKFRINKNGDTLNLKLITLEGNIKYESLAEYLKQEWEKIGIQITIQALPIKELNTQVLERNYDILIYGQNLGYNLDAYPYWHSSQAKQGFNFSQLTNFEIDTTLEAIRRSHDKTVQQKELEKAQELMAQEAPALFLYSPERTFLSSPKIKGIKLDNLLETQDRISVIHNWYVHESYNMNIPFSFSSFFDWLSSELK